MPAVRDHCIAIAQVERVSRTMEPESGTNNFQVTGKENVTEEVVLVLPCTAHHAHTDALPYLEAFLGQHFGHWGLVEGKRFKIHSVTYKKLDGAVYRETY